MDPNECARIILDATDLGSRVEALADLEGWLAGGGFKPRGSRWRRFYDLAEDGPSWRTLADELDDTTLASVPTVEALAHDLRLARDSWRGYPESREVDPETGERYSMDVRLRVASDGWYLHTGDSSYDTDHRGLWGSLSVSRRDTLATLRETAASMIREALDQWYETSGVGHGYDDREAFEALSKGHPVLPRRAASPAYRAGRAGSARMMTPPTDEQLRVRAARWRKLPQADRERETLSALQLAKSAWGWAKYWGRPDAPRFGWVVTILQAELDRCNAARRAPPC